MTRKNPPSDRDSAAAVPANEPTQRRPRRIRAEPKLYISFLPEGKGGPRLEKGSVPLEVDVEDHIEERSDCEPGLYRIEKKRSGEFSGEILFYEKEEAGAANTAPVNDDDFDSSDSIVASSSPADIAQVVNSVLESRERRRSGQPDPMDQFRQMREMLKEEREEMQRQLQEQSSKNQPRDSFSEFERFIELQKKLQPEQSARGDELTANDRAQLLLVKESGLITDFMRNIREALRAPDAATVEPTISDRLFELVQNALPYIGPTAGAAVGQKLAALVEHVDVNALAQRINAPAQAGLSPGSQNSTAPASDQRTAAYFRVIRRVALDIADNASPDASVAATLNLVNTYPEFETQFGQILHAAPGDVATFIYAQIKDDVRTLPHCHDWIASYQSKLRNAQASSTTSMTPRGEMEADESEDEPLTFDDVMHFIKQQIIDDQEPAAAVSSVIQLLAEQPDLAPTVHQLLASGNPELVQFLSQATQTDLSIVANAESFIEKMKVGVTERLRVPTNVSENGHKDVVKVAEGSRASA